MTLARLFCLSILAAACGRADAGRPETPTTIAAFDTARPWRKPGDKIDSILPMPEYLRRFREGLVEPARLTGGATSREELAARFLAGEARDTAAFGTLAVSRASSPGWSSRSTYHNPPYELDTEISGCRSPQPAPRAARTLRAMAGPRLLLSMGCEETPSSPSGPSGL